MSPKHLEKTPMENQDEWGQKMMMNTREIAKEYRLNRWAEVMQERSASGMSVRAYCKLIGLRENVYYYWQKKLREAAVTAAKQSDTGTIIKQGSGELQAITPTGWAVCAVGKPETWQSEVRIEIGKCQVVAHISTDHELLVKICRMLITLC